MAKPLRRPFFDTGRRFPQRFQLVERIRERPPDGFRRERTGGRGCFQDAALSIGCFVRPAGFMDRCSGKAQLHSSKAAIASSMFACLLYRKISGQRCFCSDRNVSFAARQLPAAPPTIAIGSRLANIKRTTFVLKARFLQCHWESLHCASTQSTAPLERSIVQLRRRINHKLAISVRSIAPFHAGKR